MQEGRAGNLTTSHQPLHQKIACRKCPASALIYTKAESTITHQPFHVSIAKTNEKKLPPLRLLRTYSNDSR